MRWNVQSDDGWQWHFALFPRRLQDGSWVWLEWVQRRVAIGRDMHGTEFLEFRANPDPEPPPKYPPQFVAHKPNTPPPPKPKR